MLEAVMFDLDGVLADTVTLGFNTRKKLLSERYGIDLEAIPDTQGQLHRAASMKVLLASIESHLGIHIDHDEFKQLELQSMHRDLPQFLLLDPALVTFLRELVQHKVTCAVVTTGQRTATDIKLETLGIKQYFSVIVTGDEIEHHKPHPEAYLYALHKLKLSTTECVIFEDSLTGVQAGVAAGCRVIGFTQYNPPQQPLLGVIAIVERWSDIGYDRLHRILANSP